MYSLKGASATMHILRATSMHSLTELLFMVQTGLRQSSVSQKNDCCMCIMIMRIVLERNVAIIGGQPYSHHQ